MEDFSYILISKGEGFLLHPIIDNTRTLNFEERRKDYGSDRRTDHQPEGQINPNKE